MITQNPKAQFCCSEFPMNTRKHLSENCRQFSHVLSESFSSLMLRLAFFSPKDRSFTFLRNVCIPPEDHSATTHNTDI